MSKFGKGIKGIPYGLMNFKDLILEGHYYVDKTHFIPKIENADNYIFFIRPRRFGKSLTLSMLQYYYDINAKDLFEPLFGEFYIGKNPTEDRNSYLVLNLNFSTVTGGLDGYKKQLDAHCGNRFERFCTRYAERLPERTLQELRQKNDAIAQLDYLCGVCADLDLKIYLFIDEYDHFTNNILSSAEDFNRYTDETHGEGYLRSFFNSVKDGTSTSIKRCFITGVSPITMDDLTSGFNIATNYTLSPEFNELMGFSEEEVRDMLTYYSEYVPFDHSVDELIEIMRPWYDNYCFAEERFGKTTMYNSNMVLYFINNYVGTGTLPKEMIETNIRVDYNKLRMLIRKDREFEHDASVIQKLVTQGFITGELKLGFPAAQITDTNNFISLLYYFGMLTISGTFEGETKLIIPNQVVKEQIFTYLLDTYEDIDLTYSQEDKRDIDRNLAYRGAWHDYFTYITDCIHRFSSQRDKMKGEAFVHGFTLSMTCHNPFYRAISELDTAAGYPDLFLCPKFERAADIQHAYLIELKYAKSTDTEAVVTKKYEEAKAQLTRYAASEQVLKLAGNTTLHKLVVLYHGIEMRYCEEIFD